MADDVHCALHCLIEGDSSLFRVKPTGSVDIMELKELIKEKGKNGVLNGVDAKDLTLWKVRMTMASDSTTDSPAG
jgi:Crinkler effector protein N-terminal domain